MKITEKQIRQIIREELQKVSSKKTSKRAIKESQRRIKLSSLLSEEDNKMDSRIENPETGRKIKIKTALGYDKSHPAYKAAKAATEKQGKKDPRGDKNSKSQGQVDVLADPDKVKAFKQHRGGDDYGSPEETKRHMTNYMTGAAIDKGSLPIKPGMNLSKTVDDIGQAVDGVTDGVSAQDFDKYKGDPQASKQLKFLAKKAAHDHMSNFTGSNPKNEKEIVKDLISKSKDLVEPKHIAALSKATKQSVEGGAGEQAFDAVTQSKDTGSGGEKSSDTPKIQTKDPEKIAKKLKNSKKLEKVINRRKSDPESAASHDEYNLMISAMMQSAGMDAEEADDMPWNEYIPPTDSHQEIIDNLAGWMSEVE